jgi:periplasmic protein TonB
MDVTDVLRDRMAEPSGLQRMVTVSLVVHSSVALALLFGPTHLFGRPAAQRPNVMTISLSGAGEGPRNGGFTPAASQPVQTVAPPAETPKREPIRPPAAATPEMVIPTNKTPVKASKTPAPVVHEAPPGARGRTPTKGAETSFGSATAYTGARGQGFGLSTGGGPGAGSRLDVADFCCPDYIATMVDRIRSAWQQNQGSRGVVIVKFVIQRDGRIADATVETSSGNPTLDIAALRAVVTTRTLNPLPAAFPLPTLPVHLSFDYQ